MGVGVGWPGFYAWLCLRFLFYVGECHLISLVFHFIICKMRLMVAAPSWEECDVKFFIWNRAFWDPRVVCAIEVQGIILNFLSLQNRFVTGSWDFGYFLLLDVLRILWNQLCLWFVATCDLRLSDDPEVQRCVKMNNGRGSSYHATHP